MRLVMPKYMKTEIRAGRSFCVAKLKPRGPMEPC